MRCTVGERQVCEQSCEWGKVPDGPKCWFSERAQVSVGKQGRCSGVKGMEKTHLRSESVGEVEGKVNRCTCEPAAAFQQTQFAAARPA